MSGSSPHFKATTAGKYVLGGTKMSLKLLESVFGFIPIPYVQVALNAACQVINVAEVRSYFDLYSSSLVTYTTLNWLSVGQGQS